MKIRHLETLSAKGYFHAQGIPCLVRVMKAAPSNETVEFHGHEFSELVFVARGSLTHVHAKGCDRLRAGDFFLIHPGLRHGYADLTKDAVVYNLLFTGDARRDAVRLLAANPLARHVFPQTDDDRLPSVRGSVNAGLARRAVALLKAIRQEEYAPHPFSAAFCTSLFAAVLSLLARGCPAEATAKRSAAAAAQEALKPELDYLEAHLGERIAVGTLRAVSGKSPSALTRLFNAAFGTSPIDYLIERRLDAAEALMASGRVTRAEAAARCGFIDASHLVRTFRRHGRPAPAPQGSDGPSDGKRSTGNQVR